MAFPSTFKDIQDDVILRARLLSANDLPHVKDWINKTYFDVCVQTEASVTTTTINLVAGTSKYTLASTVARIKQMVVKPTGGTTFNAPLVLTTLDEILQRRQNGGDATTGGDFPQSYLYTLVGISDLEVWPTPAAADVITLYYAAYPTALSGDTDVPILEEPYGTNLLLYGALSQAGDFKGDPATADWENSYDTWMGKYLQHLTLKRGDQPGQFHVWGDGNSSGLSSVG